MENKSSFSNGNLNSTSVDDAINSDLDSIWPILLSSGIFGFLAAGSSISVLVLSKFTSAGDSATLVFIRCLCVSDFLIGISGTFKSILLINIDKLLVNCFLPESLFISATTASILILVWLNLDCFLHLHQPINLNFHMDKNNIISGTVVLWSASFITGFLPQMGWNNKEDVCLFLHYYSKLYLLFVSMVWIVASTLCCVIQVQTIKIVKNIKNGKNLLSPNSKEFKKYGGMIKTVRVELITWFICFVPCAIYMIFCLSVYKNQYQSPLVNFYVPYVMLAFSLRSLVNSTIHAYKAKHVNTIVRQLSRKVGASLLRKRKQEQKNSNVRRCSCIENGIGTLPSENERGEWIHTNTCDSGLGEEQNDHDRIHQDFYQNVEHNATSSPQKQEFDWTSPRCGQCELKITCDEFCEVVDDERNITDSDLDGSVSSLNREFDSTNLLQVKTVCNRCIRSGVYNSSFMYDEPPNCQVIIGTKNMSALEGICENCSCSKCSSRRSSTTSFGSEAYLIPDRRNSVMADYQQAMNEAVSSIIEMEKSGTESKDVLSISLDNKDNSDLHGEQASGLVDTSVTCKSDVILTREDACRVQDYDVVGTVVAPNLAKENCKTNLLIRFGEIKFDFKEINGEDHTSRLKDSPPVGSTGNTLHPNNRSNITSSDDYEGDLRRGSHELLLVA